MPLTLTNTLMRPIEKYALDIVGLLTVTTNENKYILTYQDNLTKFSKAILLANQKAATVAKRVYHKNCVWTRNAGENTHGLGYKFYERDV